MPRAGSRDIFANVAHIQCVQSAANTLTFKKLETGVSLFEKIAWVIHAIDYHLTDPYDALAAAADQIEAGVTTSDQPANLNLDQVAVIDKIMWRFQAWGTPANAIVHFGPIRRYFTDLPGGGIIMPPNPIYLAVDSGSVGAAMTVDVRIFYTQKSLRAEEYWELVEARRIISST
jgi:hypothetical protein